MERNGATDGANLPALLFVPCKPPVELKNKQELEQALDALARQGYCIQTNPRWGVKEPPLTAACAPHPR